MTPWLLGWQYGLNAPDNRKHSGAGINLAATQNQTRDPSDVFV